MSDSSVQSRISLFSPEQVEVIIEKLSPYLHICPVCKSEDTLTLVPGIAYIKLYVSESTVSGLAPHVLFSCTVCGFTQFHNIHVLGIAEELGFPGGGKSVTLG
jgi:hypothetical protein